MPRKKGQKKKTVKKSQEPVVSEDANPFTLPPRVTRQSEQTTGLVIKATTILTPGLVDDIIDIQDMSPDRNPVLIHTADKIQNTFPSFPPYTSMVEFIVLINRIFVPTIAITNFGMITEMPPFHLIPLQFFKRII